MVRLYHRVRCVRCLSINIKVENETDELIPSNSHGVWGYNSAGVAASQARCEITRLFLRVTTQNFTSHPNPPPRSEEATTQDQLFESLCLSDPYFLKRFHSCDHPKLLTGRFLPQSASNRIPEHHLEVSSL